MKDGYNGIVVDAFNLSQLAEKLYSVMQSGQLLEMAENTKDSMKRMMNVA